MKNRKYYLKFLERIIFEINFFFVLLKAFLTNNKEVINLTKILVNKSKKSNNSCLYKFTKYGGEQCWECPLVKDCIEESVNKNKENNK